MWYEETVFYQIFPLGFCGAPHANDGVLEHRINKVVDWIPHLQRLNIGAVYFSPLFESDTHGYNTRDYQKLDVRLGTNEDFKHVCDELHKANIKVVVDGVFNHVGKGFWAFQDVLKNRENSKYVNWFSRIDFNGDSPDHDGLWYEAWEGCYDLVKLNLYNEEVISYLFDSVTSWINEYDIDGIRLDVAYCLPDDFCRRLRNHCDNLKPDFFLVGEMLHGEYGRILDQKNLHSLTNYQCYKGLYSAFNSANMFEIIHSLLRLFGPEDWTVARGRHLLSFCDNHDVSRIASILNDERHLPLVYTLLFTMPGIPCVYYGSEWGVKANKINGEPGDVSLRPCFEQPEWNELTTMISKLAKIKRESSALNNGGIKSLFLQNKACVFERMVEGERVIVCLNMDSNMIHANFDVGVNKGYDLLNESEIGFNNGFDLEPLSSYVIKI